MTGVRVVIGALGPPPKKVLFYPKNALLGKKVLFVCIKEPELMSPNYLLPPFRDSVIMNTCNMNQLSNL